MDHRERNALDRHITGNYGEDQFEDRRLETERRKTIPKYLSGDWTGWIQGPDLWIQRDQRLGGDRRIPPDEPGGDWDSPLDKQLSREESGRPPIDAPLSDHRRWFNNKLDSILYYHEEGGLSQLKQKLCDELVEAYMDGNKAERQTLTFAANEFHVNDDGAYIVTIEEYASKSARENPAYRLIIYHGQKKVLDLHALTTRAFDIDRHTYRNIMGDGP